MPRKKQKPHRSVVRILTPEQTDILNHFIRVYGEPSLKHMHPQRGPMGEVQNIAFATTTEGEEVIVRLDRVTHYNGVPFQLALLKVFGEFPVCLDLIWKGWTPLSHIIKEKELKEQAGA
jgi:hypothetical protein